MHASNTRFVVKRQTPTYTTKTKHNEGHRQVHSYTRAHSHTDSGEGDEKVTPFAAIKVGAVTTAEWALTEMFETDPTGAANGTALADLGTSNGCAAGNTNGTALADLGTSNGCAAVNTNGTALADLGTSDGSASVITATGGIGCEVAGWIVVLSAVESEPAEANANDRERWNHLLIVTRKVTTSMRNDIIEQKMHATTATCDKHSIA